MLETKQCAENWKKVVAIYNDNRDNGTNRPDHTADEIIKELGLSDTIETFATIAQIKKHDGRIYGKNREFTDSIEVNPAALEWTSDNPVIHAGLDSIHAAHIDNLITHLRKRAQEAPKEQPRPVRSARGPKM